MTPFYLQLIILSILALPAIFFLVLILWGLVLKGYSHFLTKDKAAKLKIYIEVTYEHFPNENFGAINPGYIFGGIIGFLVYGLLWFGYALLNYLVIDWFTYSYIGIFFTHATVIFGIFLAMFLLGAIDEFYWDVYGVYLDWKFKWEDWKDDI